MRFAFMTFLTACCFALGIDSARGQWVLDTMYPRLGYFSVQNRGDALGWGTTQIVFSTTDSDEALKTATAAAASLATANNFTITTGSGSTPAFGEPAMLGIPPSELVPFSGATIAQAPQHLDAANWAYAVGISDGVSLRAFFQIRLAGSTATVLDTSLAAQAVAVGLWSNVNDYFEFPSNHAGISPSNSPPNGPEDYFSFVVPEPTATTLASFAALKLLSRRRRGPC